MFFVCLFMFVCLFKKVAAMNEIEDEAPWCINCRQAYGERSGSN